MSILRPFNAYSIALPIIQNGSYNFKLNASLPDGVHNFVFNYIDINPNGETQNAWYFTDEVPDGTIRNGRVSPNAINWSQFPDMGIYFKTSLQNVGQNDLGQVQMFALYWIQ